MAGAAVSDPAPVPIIIDIVLRLLHDKNQILNNQCRAKYQKRAEYGGSYNDDDSMEDEEYDDHEEYDEGCDKVEDSVTECDEECDEECDDELSMDDVGDHDGEYNMTSVRLHDDISDESMEEYIGLRNHIDAENDDNYIIITNNSLSNTPVVNKVVPMLEEVLKPRIRTKSVHIVCNNKSTKKNMNQYTRKILRWICKKCRYGFDNDVKTGNITIYNMNRALRQKKIVDLGLDKYEKMLFNKQKINVRPPRLRLVGSAPRHILS